MSPKTLWSARDLEIRSRDGRKCLLASLDIGSGERVALLGTGRDFRRSLFRAFAGLEAVESGTLRIEEEVIATRKLRHPWRDLFSKKLRRKIGISLESEGLLSNVSVRESLETLFRFKYGDHNAGLVEGAHRIVEETARSVGLDCAALDLRPSSLGGLELRLASLCLAFLTKPVILMLENPSQGLHDPGWQALSETLTRILDSSQRTLIMDTDDWLLARRHTDRWIVCEADRVVFDGKPEDFIAREGAMLLCQLETDRWRSRQKWIEEIKEAAGAA